MIRKYSVACMVVCFLTAALLGPGYALASAPYMFHVDTRNQTRIEAGADLAAQILAAKPDFNASVDLLLKYTLERMLEFIDAAILFPGLTVQGLFDELSGNQRATGVLPPAVPELIAHGGIGQKHLDEVAGMAAGLGVVQADSLGDGLLSENEFWMYQFMYDVLRVVSCSGFGVYGETSTLNAPIVGRNLDFNLVTTDTLKAESYGALSSITIYENTDGKFANIGLAGMAGSVTGASSKGLYGAVIDASWLWGIPPHFQSPFYNEGRSSVIFDLRHCLENFQQLVDNSGDQGIHNYMKNRTYLYSHSLLLADANTVVVQEHPKGETLIRKTPLPGRLRTCESYTTRPWSGSVPDGSPSFGGRFDMVAATHRFVLPPELPYYCKDCTCPESSALGSTAPDYVFYSLGDFADLSTMTCNPSSSSLCCQTYGEASISPPECWEYCTSSDQVDYWPGGPVVSIADYDVRGYFPAFAESAGYYRDEWLILAPKWDRFFSLALFNSNDEQSKASIEDVMGVMSDTRGEDPILAYGTGFFLPPSALRNYTVQSMVYLPTEGRLFFYVLTDPDGHPASPYYEEISLFSPLLGDVDGNGRLELNDAILCLQAAGGLEAPVAGSQAAQYALDEKMDLKTAAYVMQRAARVRY